MKIFRHEDEDIILNFLMEPKVITRILKDCRQTERDITTMLPLTEDTRVIICVLLTVHSNILETVYAIF